MQRVLLLCKNIKSWLSKSGEHQADWGIEFILLTLVRVLLALVHKFWWWLVVKQNRILSCSTLFFLATLVIFLRNVSAIHRFLNLINILEHLRVEKLRSLGLLYLIKLRNPLLILLFRQQLRFALVFLLFALDLGVFFLALQFTPSLQFFAIYTSIFLMYSLNLLYWIVIGGVPLINFLKIINIFIEVKKCSVDFASLFELFLLLELGVLPLLIYSLLESIDLFHHAWLVSPRVLPLLKIIQTRKSLHRIEEAFLALACF